MSTLTLQDMADHAIATLDYFERTDGKMLVQIASQLTDYPVMNEWLQEDRVMVSDGKAWTLEIVDKLNNSARYVGRYEEDTVNVVNHLTSMTAQWRTLNGNYSWDVMDLLVNKGKSQLLNIVRARRLSCWIEQAQELETRAWATPNIADTKFPVGIPYSVVKYSGTPGFNGGNPSGFSDVYGINRTTVPNFKNYAGSYVSATSSDLLKKARTMGRATNFHPPTTKEQMASYGKRRRYYVGEALYSDLEDLAIAQNDNLGNDLSGEKATGGRSVRMDDGGFMNFMRHPIIHIPTIDPDTSKPFFQIDMDAFFPIILEGDNFRETVTAGVPSHNMTTIFTDLTHNFVNVNPRSCGVLAIG